MERPRIFRVLIPFSCLLLQGFSALAAPLPTPSATSSPSPTQKPPSACNELLASLQAAINTANQACSGAQISCRTKKQIAGDIACLSAACGALNGTKSSDGSTRCDPSNTNLETIKCYQELLTYLNANSNAVTPNSPTINPSSGSWVGTPENKYCFWGAISTCVLCTPPGPNNDDGSTSDWAASIPNSSLINLCKSAIDSVLSASLALTKAGCSSSPLDEVLNRLKMQYSDLARMKCFDEKDPPVCLAERLPQNGPLADRIRRRIEVPQSPLDKNPTPGYVKKSKGGDTIPNPSPVAGIRG